MGEFIAYFDKSGSENKRGEATTPEMFVSGFVSTQAKWEEFERRWPAFLSEHGINVPFHMTDFEAGEGEFQDWKGKRTEKDALLASAAKLIRQCTLRGFSEGVVCEDMKRAQAEYGGFFATWTPFAFCGLKVCNRLAQWAKRRGARYPRELQHSLEIVFERGDTGWGRLCKHVAEVLDLHPVDKPKENCRPFEAGDILAWQHSIILRRRRQGHTVPIRSSWSLARTLPASGEWGYSDWSVLKRVFDPHEQGAAENG